LQSAKWKLIIDTGSIHNLQRRLPTTPERMKELLESRQFTNGADKEAVVELYKKTALAILGTVEKRHLDTLVLKSEDEWRSPVRLVEALCYCPALEVLKMKGMQLSDEVVAELFSRLPAGSLPALKKLSLTGNRIGAKGLTSVCNALGRGVAKQLLELGLNANLFGDEGAKALAAGFRSGTMPESLFRIGLLWNNIGDEGAQSLAAALLESTSPMNPKLFVVCWWNRIGLAGQSALLQALEAKLGTSNRHYIALAFNAPTWLPAFAMLAFSQGVRSNYEKLGRTI
jgi:hypothetical protein